MRLPFTRRPLPPAPAEDTAVRVTSVPEAEIAVGSMSGIAPARIARHVLVVLDRDEDMSITTTCCKHELPKLLTAAHLRAVIAAVTPGPCYHDGGEQ
jgi:hypothetical protein